MSGEDVVGERAVSVAVLRYMWLRCEIAELENPTGWAAQYLERKLDDLREWISLARGWTR